MDNIEKKRAISKKIIDQYLSSTDSFTYSKLKKEIMSNGGHFNAVTGVSIGDYIQKLTDEGILLYDKSDYTYKSTIAKPIIEKKKKK